MRTNTGESTCLSTKGSTVWVLLILGGIFSATHIWKLAGALPWIRDDIPMSLVLAGLLLAIIQVASIVGGLPTAWAAESIGVKNLAVIGLVLLSLGSLLGATSNSYGALFVFRTLEGVGFLLYVVLAPVLIATHAAAAQKNFAIGAWATFQGVAALIGLSGTHAVLTFMSWRYWWIALGLITLAIAISVAFLVPTEKPVAMHRPKQGRMKPPGLRLKLQGAFVSLRDRNTLLAALAFTCYSAPWIAVLGFLPTVLRETSQVSHGLLGILAGLVGIANAAGALIGARLLHSGANGARVLVVSFVGAFLAVSIAFLAHVPGPAQIFWLASWLFIFSGFGGVIPSFLYRLAISITPPGATTASTLGVMQQLFNLGNLAGPPLLAWIVGTTWGWEATPLLVIGFTIMGLLSVFFLKQPLRGPSSESN